MTTGDDAAPVPAPTTESSPAPASTPDPTSASLPDPALTSEPDSELATPVAFDPDAVVGGDGQTVQIVVDGYGYQSLPPQVRVGTALSMENRSSVEDFHTVIVYRLDDGDTRSAEELAALPFEPESQIESGYGSLTGLGGSPIGTLSAPLDAPGRQVTDGASQLTLTEPGRYVLFDTLPVGVDFIAAAEAESSGDFSGLQEGPFHYEEGEIAIVEVVAEREAQPYEDLLFYGDFDQEILLYAGGTTQDACNDKESTATSRVLGREDGSVEIEVDPVTWSLSLYSSPLGAPELIDETCEAMLDDDPQTVPSEPYATGEGQVRVRIEVAADGTETVVNSAEGTVSSSDGTTWVVRGWADLEIVDGVPVGDPAEFQGLTVELVDS